MRTMLQGDPRFEQVRVRRYDWDQAYSSGDYAKLMLSYSGTQMMEPVSRELLLGDIQDLIIADFDGLVTRPLVVTLTTALKM